MTASPATDGAQPLEAQHVELEVLRRRVAQLQTALDSRVVIEQAKGVLAARLDCSVEEAFELLRRTARGHRAPIHSVAAGIVAARDVTEMVSRVLRQDGFSSTESRRGGSAARDRRSGRTQ